MIGFDSYTKLLMHMNEGTFKDECGHVLTNTNITLDSTIKKFGTSSALVGCNNRLNVSGIASNILTPPCTIDFQLYFKTYPKAGGDNIAILSSGTSFPNRWMLDIQREYIRLGTYNNTFLDYMMYTFSLNTWYHVALTVDSTKTCLFVNGVKIKEIAKVPVLTIYNSLLYVGDQVATTARDATYSLDEVRISQGIIRYIENFIPPTSPYIKSSNLIKANGSYYSIKQAYYNTTSKTYNPLTLAGGTTPNTGDIINYGFDNVSDMLTPQTINGETFLPEDKMFSSYSIKRYK